MHNSQQLQKKILDHCEMSLPFFRIFGQMFRFIQPKEKKPRGSSWEFEEIVWLLCAIFTRKNIMRVQFSLWFDE